MTARTLTEGDVLAVADELERRARRLRASLPKKRARRELPAPSREAVELVRQRHRRIGVR